MSKETIRLWGRPLTMFSAAVVSIALLTPLKAVAPAPPKIAVFDFELEDDSAAGAATGERAADIAAMVEVSRTARAFLSDSGKYAVIDTSGAQAQAVKNHGLRDCDGCDAEIAKTLGADQSLVGVVHRAEQAAYAVEVQIREASSGKVIFARREVFLGGATEWSSGVKSLLRRGLQTTP